MDQYSLRGKVRRFLNDSASTYWSDQEINGYLADGYRKLAHDTHYLWDIIYLENLPATFSCTFEDELDYATFNAGVANFTQEWERDYISNQWEAIGPATLTSPFEVTYCSWADIPGEVQLPDNIVDIDRPTWDDLAVPVISARQAEDWDTRYEYTKGEVIALTAKGSGLDTIRKVRVPAGLASTHTIDGSWGIPRLLTDITTLAPTGSWGIPRRIPEMHPMGFHRFGIPRRPYRDGTNVRLEHWREGRAIDVDTDRYEVPGRSWVYLRDYAIAQCYRKSGPAQDFKLAQMYDDRWKRGVARLKMRVVAQQRNRVSRLGGDGPAEQRGKPPRPKLPWAYGSRVR